MSNSRLKSNSLKWFISFLFFFFSFKLWLNQMIHLLRDNPKIVACLVLTFFLLNLILLILYFKKVTIFLFITFFFKLQPILNKYTNQKILNCWSQNAKMFGHLEPNTAKCYLFSGFFRPRPTDTFWVHLFEHLPGLVFVSTIALPISRPAHMHFP